jgi:hypothetical protein
MVKVVNDPLLEVLGEPLVVKKVSHLLHVLVEMTGIGCHLGHYLGKCTKN